MRISAFTQIIVTVAVTAWVFILPVKAVATILVFELALLLSIKRDRMTMAAIGGLGGVARAVGSRWADDPVPAAVRFAAGGGADGRPADAGHDDGVFVYAGGDAYPGYCPDAGGPFPPAL